MLPSVDIQRSDGNTGVVRPSPEGICAIIAPSDDGEANVVGAYNGATAAVSDLGYGPLTRYAAYMMAVTGKPVLLIKCETDTAGDYGTVTNTGVGTATPAAGATEPNDDYDVLITFVAGGALGTAGITYTYSLDGGKTKSAIKALSTSLNIDIPNTGVQFILGTSAQTILAGQTLECPTTAPQMSNTNLSAALEALRITSRGWETLLAYGTADATTVSTIDTWLSGIESSGKYKTFVVNSRFKASDETETDYATAMETAYASASSTRGAVCADGGDLASSLPGEGFSQLRATALGLAARAMATDISRDAAYVADGPIQGFQIDDDRGNAIHHDEQLYPNLDDLRLCTLRSFPGRPGAYITNPNAISPSGSDFVYLQHCRVMARASELTYQVLSEQLSLGVQTQKDTQDPNVAHITEDDAQRIEALVQTQLNANLVIPKRVSGARFVLSRTDDLSSNGPGKLTGTLQVSALRYVKNFEIKAMLVRTISVQQ